MLQKITKSATISEFQSPQLANMTDHDNIRAFEEICRVPDRGQQNWKCPWCERVLATKGQLKSHSTVHKKEKLYACNLCEKTYKWKNSLVYHHQRCPVRKAFGLSHEPKAERSIRKKGKCAGKGGSCCSNAAQEIISRAALAYAQQSLKAVSNVLMTCKVQLEIDQLGCVSSDDGSEDMDNVSECDETGTDERRTNESFDTVSARETPGSHEDYQDEIA